MAFVVLVTYDIADDRRRSQVSDRLALRGARVQLSVFECELPDRSHLGGLTSDISSMIDDDEDQVRIYALGDRGEATTILGCRDLEERRSFWIL